jgi:predicted RND superfamily exporter protein
MCSTSFLPFSHIIHFFGLQDPTLSRKQRVMLTLGEIGPSVLLGCFTTFLGVLPLAFASSEVFRIFLKMFISIVVIGGAHGLIVLPVILSFVGPSIARGPTPAPAKPLVESPGVVSMT